MSHIEFSRKVNGKMPENSDKGNVRVDLIPPWAGPEARQSLMCSETEEDFSEKLRMFLEIRTDLHIEFILQDQKTRRLGLMLGVVLVIAACALVEFAPERNQHFSYWIGAALVIVAAGCVGYKRLWGKSRLLEFEARESQAVVPGRSRKRR